MHKAQIVCMLESKIKPETTAMASNVSTSIDQKRGARKHCKRWFIDISNVTNVATRHADLPAPYSYVKTAVAESSERNKEVDPELLVKRSWEIALGPIKQVPMNLFMMWMAGSSISIFPIMMVGMMVVRPIQAFMTIGQTFKMIEGNQAILQKLAYVGGNLVGIALAMYKCNSMGLLPTHASDWLAFAEQQRRMEYLAGGVALY